MAEREVYVDQTATDERVRRAEERAARLGRELDRVTRECAGWRTLALAMRSTLPLRYAHALRAAASHAAGSHGVGSWGAVARKIGAQPRSYRHGFKTRFHVVALRFVTQEAEKSDAERFRRARTHKERAARARRAEDLLFTAIVGLGRLIASRGRK